MATQNQQNSTDPMSNAIATATQIANMASQTFQSAVNNMSNATTAVGDTFVPPAVRLVEQTTESVGKFVAPIAENPLIKYAGKLPGINFLMTALGNIDLDKAQQEVDKLKQEYPQETSQQLAHRVIVDTALKGGGIGLLSNFVPPLALALFAVDIVAVTTLQAEMVYRIAAVYGFELKDSTRRGEVLAIFGLSVAGSGVTKVGLGLVELIPGVGAVVGASSNAAVLYSLGYAACQFYEAKKSLTKTNGSSNGNIATY